jgi:4-hydroxybenzoate polyprenyltransferase
MKHFLLRLINRVERAPLTLGSFIVAFLALIIARLTVENTLGLFSEHSFFFFFFEFTHTLLFFLCSFILLIPVVRFAGGSDLKKAVNILLFGFLIILTPPILDTLIIGQGRFWSFYEFDGLFGLFQRFFTLFGDTPDIGITYGVRIEVVLVTMGVALYAFLKTKSLKITSLAALLTYTVLFILGTFPAWVTLLVLSPVKGLLTITSNDVAALFLSPEHVLGRDLDNFRSVLNLKMSLIYALLISILSIIFLFRHFPRYFWALMRNARFPQLVYHGGLLFLGILLALFFSVDHFTLTLFSSLSIGVLLLAVECAWLTSVIINDLHDTAIDQMTNPSRPLIQQTIPQELYPLFGILFFIASLVFSGIVSFSALLILIAYQALALLYSAPPLRLKQYPLFATLFASAAGMLVLITGFVSIAPSHSIESLPLPLLVYLFLAYFLVLPIKDFKDIAGDEKDHVLTLPVLLGELLAKQVIGSLLFLLYMGSPFLLNMRGLFFPALIVGGLSFLTIQKGSPDEKSFFAFRKLPGLILLLTIFYGSIIAFFLI